ncbi:MAG: adenylate/guanylate cyclase domain-containing protein, partial [Acidiferrobacterales bacterium]
MEPKSLERKLAAIFYADVAGYSRLTGEDEEGTHRLLSTYLDAITEFIERHHGKVMHFAGDAVLADFATVSDALTCAAAVQQDLERRNQDLPEERKVQFRIGVNLGEVIVDRDEIYGDGVNVAARLESLAEPGGICISEAVRSAVGKKLPLDYEFMGEQQVKNIAEPVKAYSAQLRPGATLPAPRAKRRRPMRHVVVASAVAAVLIIAVGVIAWFAPRIPT